MLSLRDVVDEYNLPAGNAEIETWDDLAYVDLVDRDVLADMEDFTNFVYNLLEIYWRRVASEFTTASFREWSNEFYHPYHARFWHRSILDRITNLVAWDEYVAASEHLFDVLEDDDVCRRYLVVISRLMRVYDKTLSHLHDLARCNRMI